MQLKRKIKRITAFLLCVLMCLTVFSTNIQSVYATDNIPEQAVEETQSDLPDEKADIEEKQTEEQSGKEAEDSITKNTESETPAPQPENEGSKEEDTRQLKETNTDVSDEPAAIADYSNVRIADTEFSTDDIQKAGITDFNFAQAVYNSIISQPDKFVNGKMLADYSDVVTILNEFTGTIDASGTGKQENEKIRSIEGIHLLQSADALDLTDNLVTDFRPLGVDDPHYYGTPKNNLDIKLAGNKIIQYPKYAGGRISISPDLGSYNTVLPTKDMIFVTDGSKNYSGSAMLNFKSYLGDDVEFEIDENITGISQPSPDYDSTPPWNLGSGATFPTGTQLGGVIDGFAIENVINTGSFEINMQTTEASRFTYTTVDGRNDTGKITPYYLTWYAPVKTLIYAKTDKKNTTAHKVTLTKYGRDDGAVKDGASYSLYRKSADGGNDELISGNYITKNGGKIEITNPLSPGTYYFKENTNGAPDGYDINTEPTSEFVISDGELVVDKGSYDENGSFISTKVTELTGEDGKTYKSSGTFMLSGDESEEDKVQLSLNMPENVSFESITVEWTDGNKGGEKGRMQFVVGTGSNDTTVTYVENKEAALEAAENQIAASKKLYQNVELSASFKQRDIEITQDDPLTSVPVQIYANKNLFYADGATKIESVPKFRFQLVHADGNTPELNMIKTNGTDGSVAFEFKVGKEITVDTPKNGNTYIYRYILKELPGDSDYQYDPGEWEITVPVIKGDNGLRVDEENILYTKKDSSELGTTTATFKNIRHTIPFTLTKVSEDGKTAIKDAEFAMYRCINEETHDYGEACIWEEYKRINSGKDGKIDFGDIPIASHYKLVETVTPEDMKKPSADSYILVDISDISSIEERANIKVKGYGEFAGTGMVTESDGIYSVKNYYYYDLQINKTVKGELANTEKVFAFTITLTGEDGKPINGTYNYQKGNQTGTLKFKDGKTDIQLRHGESIVIKDVVAYTTYKIEETGADAYITTVEQDSNEGKMDKDKVVSFINRKDDIPVMGVSGIGGTGIMSVFVALFVLAGGWGIFRYRKRTIHKKAMSSCHRNHNRSRRR